MDNSICPDARKCGSFKSPACTQEMRTKDCSGPIPLKPNSSATDQLHELLPEPILGGDCKICGDKNVKVYRVNQDVVACENCYFFFVLPRNSIPIPKKQITPTAKSTPATA